MYIRSAVVSILIILSLVILYRFQSDSVQPGRQVALVLSFQNLVNREVPKSEYTVKLPYGFEGVDSDSTRVRVDDTGQSIAHVVFDNTPKYSGRTVTLEGVIHPVDLSDLVTNSDGCLELLNVNECLALAGAFSREDRAEVALKSYERNKNLMHMRDIALAQWVALIDIYGYAKVRAEEGDEIRLTLGVDSMSSVYQSILRLEYRSSAEGGWVDYWESVGEGWLPVEVVSSLGVSWEGLGLVEGYGLSLVKTEASLVSSLPSVGN